MFMAVFDVHNGHIKFELKHEKEVRVFLSSATIEVSKGSCVRDMVRHHSQPEKTSQDHTRPSLVTLDTPTSCKEDS